MPTFQVPQFIEQKPKIIGPFTLSQFFYIAGAAGLSFAAYYVFSFFFWITFSVVLVGGAISLAFVKVNGEELPKIIQSSLGYLLKPRIYIWQRTFAQKTFEITDLEQIENLRRGMSFQEKLKSIALSVATGKLFSLKDARLQEKKENYQTVTFLTGERRLVKKVDFTNEKGK